jgi:hypothetical protein
MSPALQAALNKIKHLISKGWDFCILIDGFEGTGKSTLGFQVAVYLDPTFDLSQVCFTGDETENVIMNAKNRQAVVFDEGMTDLYARQAMTKGNINLNKLLAQCRQKELALIIIMPSFFECDRYVALHRSRVLLHCYAQKDGERGYFMFYNRSRKKRLYFLGKPFMQDAIVPPNFKDHYPKYMAVDEVEYKKRKWQAMTSGNTNRNRKDARDQAFQILLQILFDEGRKSKELAEAINKNAGKKIIDRRRLSEIRLGTKPE